MCNYHGCITLAKNPTHHFHTKHIDVQHHFIREKLKNQKICLKCFPKEDMIVDVLTKSLAKGRYQTLLKVIGLEALYSTQSGSVKGIALYCL